MLPVMFRYGWFPTLFNEFLDTDLMPRANTTAPAVNVKEDESAYTMELAAPGIKKEYCRVSINDDGNLCIAIENKMEHKDEDNRISAFGDSARNVATVEIRSAECQTLSKLFGGFKNIPYICMIYVK